MAKKSMILKQQAEPKFSTRRSTAARSAADPTLICGTTAFAVSASVSWPTRARFPVSARPAGNPLASIESNVKKVWEVLGRWVLTRASHSPDTPEPSRVKPVTS